MDAFASHVIRALLTLLSPRLFPAEHSSSMIRSKKSAVWKSHQGPMKSVFAKDLQGTDRQSSASKAPPDFTNMARRFVDKLRDDLDANEVRALAANQFASPVLQVTSFTESYKVL
jgi:nucleolar protein 9